jgi:hypothetical protein
MSNILSISSDSKTIKGEKFGYLTGIFYGSPQRVGRIKCVSAFFASLSGLMPYHQGRASVFKTIKASRIRKTIEFKRDSQTFREKLRKEIGKW